MDSVAAIGAVSTSTEASQCITSLPHCVLHRVFQRLSAKELCQVSAVCRLWRQLNRDVVGERRWKHHYKSRWAYTDASPSRRWAVLYADRVEQSCAYKGRFAPDGLFGHRAGVRSLQLLPEENLLATGSLDRTVRVWDLDQGMPLCTSRLHEGTVRSLVMQRCHSNSAVRLMSGSEATIRIWTLPLDVTSVELGEPTKLRGHTGPISALQMSSDIVFSGSWDCSVSLWKETTSWEMVSRYVYPDWVWAVQAMTHRFVVCSGRKVIVQDIQSGKEIASLPEFLTEGHVSCCKMTQNEQFIMTGATDGIVRLHDLRCRRQIVEMIDHGSGITDLAFEDPWLVAGSLDGTLSLVNLESRLHPELQRDVSAEINTRQLQCHSGPVYCVDMSHQWIAGGGEQPTVSFLCDVTVGKGMLQVRTWDFTKAVAAAKKAEIARTVRKNRKNRLRPLRVDPVQEEVEEGSCEEEEAASEPLPASCRLQQRHSRRARFWNSFGYGDSTDDSEIIDAFG